MSEINQTNILQKTLTSYQASQSTANAKNVVNGAGTYGAPKLSDEALDYYNELKKKYSNLNFVLVSSEKKEEANAIKDSFASGDKLTVLIDTDKIEQMATDNAYREKYEGILDNAASGITKMKQELGSMTDQISAYGMTFGKNGELSYFAVIDESLAKQKERLEEQADKKENKRAGEKTTFTANSLAELRQKIEDYYQEKKTALARTKEEQSLGQKVDFSV